MVLRRVSAQMSASLSGTVSNGGDRALMLAQMDLHKATKRCEFLQEEVNALRDTVKSLEVDLARAMHAKENLLLELGNSLSGQAAQRAQDAATSAVEIGRLRAALADAGIPAPVPAPRNRREAVFNAVACPRLEDVQRERERSDVKAVEEYIRPKPSCDARLPDAQPVQLGGRIQSGVAKATSHGTTTTSDEVNLASFVGGVGLELGL